MNIYFLANKYNVHLLIKKVEEYIKKERNSIIEDFFTTKRLDLLAESILSDEFESIIQDERLLQFPISIINRLLCQYIHKNKLTKEKEYEIIDFIIKYIKNSGKEFFFIFNKIDLSRPGQKYLFRELKDHKEIFDLDAIQNKIIERIISNEEKDKEKEKKYYKEIEKLTEKMNNNINKITKEMRDEMEKMKNESQNDKNEFEQKLKEMKDEIKKVKNKSQNDKNDFEQQNKELKIIIFDLYSSQNFYPKDDLLRFNKFKGETQVLLLNGMKNNNIQNKFYNNICNLISFFSSEHQKCNFKFNQSHYISIESNEKNSTIYKLNGNEKIIIQSNVINMLHESKLLDSIEFVNLIGNFNCVYFMIQYQDKNNQSLLNNLITMKEMTKTKINVEFSFSGQIELIKDYEFSVLSLLTSIKIPSSVKSIGNYAFNECSSLKQIEIPSSVEFIGEGAFSGCCSLSNIGIPSSVKSIGNYAFNKCSSLKQIEIPSSVKSIEECSFFNCSSLTKIAIPYSIKSIGKSAFYKCSSLKQISIPSSVTFIGNNAFFECSSLVKISIPSIINERRIGINSKVEVKKI